MMHHRMGSGPTPRPVTAYPHKVDANNAGSPGDAFGTPRPIVSLVTDASSDLAYVENTFFARGLAEDQAALAQYASLSGLVRRRAAALGRRHSRMLLIGGAVAALLLAITGLHRMGSRDRSLAVAQTPDSIPVAPAMAASPAPAAPALAVAQAPAAQANPGIATPAAEPSAAPTAAPAQPAAAEGVPALSQPSTPPPIGANPADLAAFPGAAESPARATAGGDRASAVAAAPSVAAPAAVPQATEPAAAPPDQPIGQVGIAAKAAPTPAEPPAIRPAAAPSELPTGQACREAVKKRDVKAVTATCEAALQADASLVRPLLAFAKAQFEQGRSARAATWARKVLQIDDSLADAYLILGVAEQEARRPSAAKTAYQRYLDLAPRGAYANDVRSSLKSL